jgi:hypothetical protein
MKSIFKRFFPRRQPVKTPDTTQVFDSVTIEKMVVEGTKKAIKDYKKTFKILAEYDKK